MSRTRSWYVTLAVCVVASVIFCPATTQAQPAPKAAKAEHAAPGKARLVVTRTDSMLYFGLSAAVKVNGSDAASLMRGESKTLAIVPGKTAVSVTGWSYPGSWTVNFDAKPGKTYTVEISPRGDSYVSTLFGPVGVVIDATANKNGGAFQMRVLTSQ